MYMYQIKFPGLVLSLKFTKKIVEFFSDIALKFFALLDVRTANNTSKVGKSEDIFTKVVPN